MLFSRKREKELSTVWKLEKNGNTSFLVGTAHFYPYSVRTSLAKLFRDNHTVIFEGPLDEESMGRVRAAGACRAEGESLLELLDNKTRDKIRKILAPERQRTSSAAMLKILTTGAPDPVVQVLGSMKPWLAFFTIYTKFLEKIGWKHSVDREAYEIAMEMGKEVVFLETIEEQVEVLEGLSVPQIVDFLTRIDQWEGYAKQFVARYLDADVESIKSNRIGFPTRHPMVIDGRDELFVERAGRYFRQGDAVLCVGVPHVVNMKRMLRQAGFSVDRCRP